MLRSLNKMFEHWPHWQNFLFVCLFDLIQHFFSMSRQVFFGWTTTNQGLMWLAQGHNASEARTRSPSVSRHAHYHWAIALRAISDENVQMHAHLNICCTYMQKLPFSALQLTCRSKWAWSGNTTITQCRLTHSYTRKSRRTQSHDIGNTIKPKQPSLSSSSKLENTWLIMHINSSLQAVVQYVNPNGSNQSQWRLRLVQRWTGDRMVDSSRVVRDSELFPWARHYNRCLVLVQPRKTGNGSSMTKNCWQGPKTWPQTKWRRKLDFSVLNC